MEDSKTKVDVHLLSWNVFYEVKVGIRRVKIEMLNVWVFCAATFLIVKLDY